MIGYVTLPANGKDFPSNTNSTYTVKLEKALTLEAGQWEVGLTEIQFPSSWVNVPRGTITNTLVESSPTAGSNPEHRIEYYVRKGRYTSIDELIGEINRAQQSYGTSSKFSIYFDKITNKCVLMIRDDNTRLQFSRDLAIIFGLDKDIIYKKGRHKSTSSPDIFKGFRSLYVYSDLAAPRFVGDVLAPLLRVVPIDSTKRFSDQYVDFTNIQYIPIANFSSDLINVLIRQDNGEEVPFTSGKVVLTVHIRKVQN